MSPKGETWQGTVKAERKKEREIKRERDCFHIDEVFRAVEPKKERERENSLSF